MKTFHKISITSLFLLCLNLNSRVQAQDSITTANQDAIQTYLTKANEVLNNHGTEISRFIGKVKGQGFFKKLEKKPLDPVKKQFYLINNSGLNDNVELQTLYQSLADLHNETLTEIQSQVANANAYSAIISVNFKSIYDANKAQISSRADEFIKKSYELRTGSEHAGIIQIITAIFEIKNLLDKFSVNLEETAKPIIIANLEKRKLPSWDVAIANSI
ncbi:hypothetical protein [Mangrovimonas xylaniphaga]|uniref:hypothetical protein n=1 Tax=Mangrovimonas xylaniphaga TaxID=1645915 RepID=UPI0006B464C7|nr:hypothetical protein [Mangrovimonas xylaniphaga]